MTTVLKFVSPSQRNNKRLIKKNWPQIWENLIANFAIDIAEDGKDDLRAKYLTQILNDWDRYEHCWAQGLRTFNKADTQSRKTLHAQVKMWLAVIKGNYDIIFFLCPNMKDSLTTTHERFWKDKHLYPKANPRSIGLSKVELTEDLLSLPTFNNDCEIFVTMTNVDRINMCRKIVEYRLNAPRYQQYNRPKKVLIIWDEAEMFSENTVTLGAEYKPAETEKALNDFISYMRSEGMDVHIDEYSATLWSKMLLQHYIGETVTGQQVFDLPVSDYYIGFNNGKMKIDASLIDEQKSIFSDKKGYKCRVWGQTANLGLIAKHINSKVNDTNYGYNANGLPTICTAVLGREKEGQTNGAGLYFYALENIGYVPAFWDSDKDITLPEGCDSIVMTYNGGTKGDRDISQKLMHIADKFKQKFDRNPRHIMIFVYNMGSRSITVEIKDKWYDPNSNYFGWYASGTVILTHELKNIEAEIQLLRATGVRPFMKEHFVLCTQTFKDELLDYPKWTNDFYSQMKANPTTSIGVFEVEKIGNHLKMMAKGAVDKQINRELITSGTIPNSDRTIYPNVVLRDMLIPLTKSLIDLANSNKWHSLETRKAFDQFGRANGFPSAATHSDEVRCVRFNTYTSIEAARSAVIHGWDQSHDFNGYDPHTIYTWVKIGNDDYLYCYNKEGVRIKQKGKRGQGAVAVDYIEYNMSLQFDPTCKKGKSRLVFLDSEKYLKSPKFKPRG